MAVGSNQFAVGNLQSESQYKLSALPWNDFFNPNGKDSTNEKVSKEQWLVSGLFPVVSYHIGGPGDYRLERA